jgi:hypothetical protein
MHPILYLDPVPEPAAAIDIVAVLGDQTLESEQARMPEQVRPDLALFEIRQEDPVDSARQACLAQAQRQFADVLTAAHQDVEGVELDLVIVLPAVQAVEIRSAVDY